MPISGLVIKLGEREAESNEALQMLRDDPRIDLGVRQGRRQAIVAETESSSEDTEIWESLHALPGIEGVDVIFIDWGTEAR